VFFQLAKVFLFFEWQVYSMSASLNKRLSLGIKVTAVIAALIVGGMSVLGLTVLSKQNQLQDEQLEALGQALAAQTAAAATEPLFTGDSLSLQLQAEQSIALARIKAVQISSSVGEVLAYAGDISALVDSAGSQQHYYFVSDVTFRDIAGGRVELLLESNELAKTYEHILRLVLIVGGSLTVAGLFFAILIGRKINQPINMLLDATERIGAGDYNAVVAVERRDDEIGQLLHAISDMGQGLYQRDQVESMLAGFVNQDIAKQVVERAAAVNIKGERVEATVLFADIVGFTSMSETLSPEQVAELLNEYFAYFAHCSDLYFGTVDKFIGDCVMVVFGAPKANVDHRFNAAACAFLMQRLTQALNHRRRIQGLPEVLLRIGINSGDMLAGVLGSDKKMEYTVVGDSVNLASRLCNEANSGQIIVTEEFKEMLLDADRVNLNSQKKIKIRGKTLPVQTFEVTDIASEYQLTMNTLIDDLLSTKEPL
jgi:adenylate cyclase